MPVTHMNDTDISFSQFLYTSLIHMGQCTMPRT